MHRIRPRRGFTLVELLATIAIIAVLADDGRVAGQENTKPFSPRLAALQKELDAGNRAALDRFWKEVKRTPLVEAIPDDARHLHVTFIWRAKEGVKSVEILSPLDSGPSADRRMQRLADSDLWYKTYKLRNDARVSYRFSPAEAIIDRSKLKPEERRKLAAAMRPDPLNPLQFGKPNEWGYRQSVLELPKAPPQPWIERRPKAPAGTLTDTKFKSRILSNERAITVYTPPGYAKKDPPHGLLVVFDRDVYISKDYVDTPVILDNLLAEGKIPPLVAVFVGNVERNKELPCHAPFADFLAKELIPWVRSEYGVTNDPSRTIVAGSSYGGLAATFAALKHPEVFGNVLSQSGSYPWSPRDEDENEWLIRQFVASPKLPVRFYLDVGLFEAGIPLRPHATSQVAANRHLRDVLNARGYSVQYAEFNGGHSYLNWRGTFADGLFAVSGTGQKRHQ